MIKKSQKRLVQSSLNLISIAAKPKISTRHMVKTGDASSCAFPSFQRVNHKTDRLLNIHCQQKKNYGSAENHMFFLSSKKTHCQK